ncbi:MAG: PadR family transcriptional regulator [Candidatus Bathyarchaeia archaeon]
MEKGVLREVQERIVRSFLDVLILAQLRKEPKSAYDIIAFIHEKFHILMSAGAVYSTMYSLERDGLVQGNFADRKRRARVYTLTDKGEKTIQAFLNVNDKIQLFVANLVGGPSG